MKKEPNNTYVPYEALRCIPVVRLHSKFYGSWDNQQFWSSPVCTSRHTWSYCWCQSDAAGWRMVLVDLRNHGQSASLPAFTPPHDIPAAARDIADLIKAEGWGTPDAMIAHSLGGKVVLEFAQKAAAGFYNAISLPKQVVHPPPGLAARALKTLNGFGVLSPWNWIRDMLLSYVTQFSYHLNWKHCIANWRTSRKWRYYSWKISLPFLVR